MKYLLLTLVLLSIVNASMRWSSDPDDVLPLINDDKKEDLKMDTESFDSASDFEDFPYDTSLLWAPRASKSVRFDLTGTKEGEKMLLNHITQTSPDTVTKLFDLSSSFGELIDEDPISNKVVISVEWIKELLIPCFKADDMIPIELVKQIIAEGRQFFSFDDTIHTLSVPSKESKIIVVGDIHGQFDSTISIFEEFGYPSAESIYLFNGDIVDRGDKSIECVLLLFAYKIALPDHFFVDRGNHETRGVKKEKFFTDCNNKLSEYPEAFEDFHNAFDDLPYGFVVQKFFFVTHGGLGPKMDLSELSILMRPLLNHQNVYEFFCMLWNDPCEADEPVNECFLAPSTRGQLCRRFHPIITAEFLHHHKLKMLVRSHELVADGARYSQNNMCLTIFSAPNYRNTGNRGAVLVINHNSFSVQQISASS